MKKNRIAPYLSGALSTFGINVLFNYLPHYAKEMGATNLEIGLLGTLYWIVLIFASPSLGALSDVLENRKIFPLAGVIAFSFIFYFFSIAKTVKTILFLRVLTGIALPAFLAPTLALISEHTATERRGGSLGWFNTFRAFGSMLGLLIIGQITDIYSLSEIFFYLCFFVSITVIPILFYPDNLFSITIPPRDVILEELYSRIFPETQEGSSLLKEYGLIYLYLSIVMRVICIFGFVSFLPVFVIDELGYSLEFYGIFAAIGMGIQVVSHVSGGKLSDIIGRRNIIVIGFILTAAAPVSYALSKYFSIGLWVGRIGHLVGYGFVWSGSSAFVGDIARKREEATLMGWINMAWGIGGAIGPIIMGTLLAPLGYLGTAIIFSLFGLSGLILVTFKLEETK